MTNVRIAGIVHRWSGALSQGVPIETVCGILVSPVGAEKGRTFVEVDQVVDCAGCIFVAGVDMANRQGSLWDGAL